MSMKKLFTILAALCALVLPANAAIGVTTYPIPEGGPIVSVSPAQGSIDLTGSANPLGATEITFTFVSNDITINTALTETIKIYIDGAEEPAEELTYAACYVDMMENPLASFKFKHKYIDPGLYHITVPEGLFYCQGKPSQAIELGYEIYIPWEVTPAPDTYDSISEFEMVFPDYNEVEVVGNGYFQSVQGGGKSYTIDYEVIQEEGVDPNRLRLTLNYAGMPDQVATDSGEYRLEFPANAFKLTAYGPQHAENPEDKVVEYTTELLMYYYIRLMPQPTIEPAEGEVANFMRWNVTYPSNFEIIVGNDKSNSNGVFRVLPDGQLAHESVCLVKPIGRDGSVVNLAVCNPNTGQPMRSAVNPGPGKYALCLTAGLMSGYYKEEFVNSDPCRFYYTIPTPIFDIKVSPEADTDAVLDELKDIVITFPEATNMAVNPYQLNQATITDENGEKVENHKVEVTVAGAISPLAEGSETEITADVTITPAITKQGKYTINIPDGYFLSGTLTSPAYTLTYNVSGNNYDPSGFEELEAAGLADVYTMTGIQVLKAADKAAVNALPAGLYIVNGKKVAIR